MDLAAVSIAQMVTARRSGYACRFGCQLCTPCPLRNADRLACLPDSASCTGNISVLIQCTNVKQITRIQRHTLENQSKTGVCRQLSKGGALILCMRWTGEPGRLMAPTIAEAISISSIVGNDCLDFGDGLSPNMVKSIRPAPNYSRCYNRTRHKRPLHFSMLYRSALEIAGRGK